MKFPILSTATILLISLGSAYPSMAQLVNVTCSTQPNSTNCRGLDRDINGLFQQYLGRDAEDNALQSYRSQIINGRSVDDVRNEIVNSVEARNYLMNSATANSLYMNPGMNRRYDHVRH